MKKELALSFGILASACMPAGPVEVQDRSIATPYASELATATVTPIRTESLGMPHHPSDFDIRGLINQADAGDVLELREALIPYLLQFTLENKAANLATLNTFAQGKNQITAVLYPADCLLDFLRKEGELSGLEIHGARRANKRIDLLHTEVLTSPSENPIPILAIREAVYKNVRLDCPQVEITDSSLKIISKIPWRDISENRGLFMKWYVRVHEIINREAAEPTATPLR